MAERAERTRLDRQFRRDLKLLTFIDGRTPAAFARDLGIDRKIVSLMSDPEPEFVVISPKPVVTLVIGLNNKVDDIYKAYMLGLVGYQLPLYPRMHVWNINLGSIGTFMDNLVKRYNMNEAQIQWFGDIVTSFADRVADFIMTGGRRPPFADNPVTV